MSIRVSPRTLAAAAALLVAAAPAAAQHTIGDPLFSRLNLDTFSNFIVVSDYAFPATAHGMTVQSVSIFGGRAPAGTNVGRTFVPLLVTAPSGGSFTVTGVGTPRVVGLGVQAFAFGLTEGSALVGATTRVAWLAVGPGPVHYDADADGNVVHFTANGAAASVNAGDTFAVAGTQDRAYSIQFTADVTAVPEPSTVALVAGGLVALVGIARRRT